MSNLSNSLSKISILTEAPDDLFDIDKEVDAQIKRVEKRIERKNTQEAQNNNPENEQDNELNREEEYDETNQETETMDNDEVDNPQDQEVSQNQVTDNPEETQKEENPYIDGTVDTIPDNYEPKQSIPELRILSTLSDSEYALCNIRILEHFAELKRNVQSAINNIIMNITTKNAKQRQVVDIVHDNLRDMLEDIDNFTYYRNNGVYEENVTAYLTYLKRYQIATKLIKVIAEENYSKNDDK